MDQKITYTSLGGSSDSFSINNFFSENFMYASKLRKHRLGP